MVLLLYTDKLPHTVNANAGLRFNKFCNTWYRNEHGKLTLSAQKDGNPKLTWINKFTGKKIPGKEDLLNESIIRRELLLTHCDGQVLTMQTRVAFVTGMGNPHPIENGFTWHHTLGVPFLPGSSVKGLVRDWAQNWLSDLDTDCWKNQNKKNQTMRRLFGSDIKTGSENNKVGNVIFLDALPIKPVKLKAEIMTPHYSEYYQDDEGTTAPGDWLSPNPIPFLAVDQGQLFQFAVLPRRKNDETYIKDAQLAIRWLQTALSTLGAGAKTAAGYGQMEPAGAMKNSQTNRSTDISTEQERRAKAFQNAKDILQRNNFTAMEKQLYDLEQQYTRYLNNNINKENIRNELRSRIKQLIQDAPQWDSVDRKKVVDRLSKIYITPGLYNKNQKKNIQKALSNI